MFRIAATTLSLALLAFVPAAASVAAHKTQHAKAATKRDLDSTDTKQLRAAIAGDWRDPKNTPRDRYRHPLETLSFFRVNPRQTVVEITPGGGGWYTEILAPYLREKGKYIGAMVDASLLAEGRSRDGQRKSLDDLNARIAKSPTRMDRAEIVAFDRAKPRFAEAGSVDTVLTFRNVHNWVAAGNADAYFKAFFEALKPGGTLGVVDHRAKPGTDLEKMKDSGYLTEALVIKLATDAGFALDAKSEINANPKDTTDHPNGVWTLPPTNDHPPEDDAKYAAIGESDRMTLRFVKRAKE